MKTYKHLDVRAVSAERSELKEKAAQYPYVIAHMYSDILCGNCVHDGINWDELVELRAFDEKGELHVYEQNGSLKAVEITEKENADAEEDTVIKMCIRDRVGLDAHSVSEMMRRYHYSTFFDGVN